MMRPSGMRWRSHKRAVRTAAKGASGDWWRTVQEIRFCQTALANWTDAAGERTWRVARPSTLPPPKERSTWVPVLARFWLGRGDAEGERQDSGALMARSRVSRIKRV